MFVDRNKSNDFLVKNVFGPQSWRSAHRFADHDALLVTVAAEHDFRLQQLIAIAGK